MTQLSLFPAMPTKSEEAALAFASTCDALAVFETEAGSVCFVPRSLELREFLAPLLQALLDDTAALVVDVDLQRFSCETDAVDPTILRPLGLTARVLWELVADRMCNPPR